MNSKVVFSKNFKSVSDIARICDSAANFISQEIGVPKDVLLAITRTETGRTIEGAFLPWPWTVNIEGRGNWFASQKEAIDFVQRHQLGGAKSFDVGCFQINYRWHGSSFRSVDEMFEPIANARYAAKFLFGLHQEFGSWTDAAGAYHSRTPKYSRRYKKRFYDLLLDVRSERPTHSSRVRPADRSEHSIKCEENVVAMANDITHSALVDCLGVSNTAGLGGLEQRVFHHLSAPILRTEP